MKSEEKCSKTLFQRAEMGIPECWKVGDMNQAAYPGTNLEHHPIRPFRV
jgi:hypothetical protein